MNSSEIAKHRLVNQQLVKTSFKTAVEMVAWFGAVQAQEYAQTKWSLGLRLPHLKDNDIEKDFKEGKILRTHFLRPTWHFVAAKDIRWMLMLTASRVHGVNSYMYRKLELTAAIFKRCNNILIKTLRGHKQLTRDSINKEFKKNKIEAEGHRLSYIMMQAELDGIICSGARQGNQFTYSLLEERVPEFKSKNRVEALAELTKRYFTSRGPATIKDFSTWSGLALTDCKNGIEMVKSLFYREVIANREYFFPPGISLHKNQFQKIHLLPIYDEFIMGYKDRSSIMLFKTKNAPASAFRYDNMIIFDGQIIGTWKRVLKSKCIDMTCDFFDNPNKVQFSGFEKAIQRFEEFNNLMVNRPGTFNAKQTSD
jgi:hypothetical protein